MDLLFVAAFLEPSASGKVSKIDAGIPGEEHVDLTLLGYLQLPIPVFL